MFERLILYVAIGIERCPFDCVGFVIDAPNEVGVFPAEVGGTIGQSGDILAKGIWLEPVDFELKPFAFAVIATQISDKACGIVHGGPPLSPTFITHIRKPHVGNKCA